MYDNTGYDYLIPNWSKMNPLDMFDYGVCVKNCPTVVDPTIDCNRDECPVADANNGYLDGSYSLLGICLPTVIPTGIQTNFDLIK